MKTGNARFDAFIDILLEFETEFNPDGSVKVERDPHDSGGTTKFGIDQRSHPKLNIAALDYAGAIRIYFEDWTKMPCDELPRPLGELLFDISQNGGPGAKWIQQGLVVKPDGWIGPKTLLAAAMAARTEPYILLKRCIHHVCDMREDRFLDLAQRYPKNRRFLRGWLRRNEAMRAWALSHIGEAKPSTAPTEGTYE